MDGFERSPLVTKQVSAVNRLPVKSNTPVNIVMQPVQPPNEVGQNESNSNKETSFVLKRTTIPIQQI